jgi:hypothetical protein
VKLLDKIKKSNYLLINFGIDFWLRDILRRAIFKNNSNISTKINKQYDSILLDKLKVEFSQIIEKYNNQSKDSSNCIESDSPIWILWWQGESNMPETNTIAFNSVKKNAGNHPVILLTKDNVRDYCSIPDYIFNKLNDGTLSLINFSDILRFNLLSENGGIWIDSTLLVTEKLDKLLGGYPFFTIHHERCSETHICKGKWSTFFLAASRNNNFMKFMNEMLLEYCNKYDYFVTYLLIDYFITLGFEEISVFNQIISKVPVNNTGVFEMEYKLNGINSPETQFNDLKKDAFLFKLTYKNEHYKMIDNKKTLYGFLRELYGNF